MQILHWLSKLAQKQSAEDKKTKSKEVVFFIGSDGVRRRRVEKRKLNCKNYLSLFCFSQRKDVPKACFYHTLNLRRLGSLNRRKMKKKEFAHKADSKVLPITDHSVQTASSRNINNDQCPGSDKKEKAKGHRTKGFSRMKELMKWAATAKGEKGGKEHNNIGGKVKNKAVLKAVQDGDQFSNDSPKISFRCDGVDSCSTTSSVYLSISAISRASSLKNGGDECVGRTGNWITTDSEFVVLEL